MTVRPYAKTGIDTIDSSDKLLLSNASRDGSWPGTSAAQNALLATNSSRQLTEVTAGSGIDITDGTISATSASARNKFTSSPVALTSSSGTVTLDPTDPYQRLELSENVTAWTTANTTSTSVEWIEIMIVQPSSGGPYTVDFPEATFDLSDLPEPVIPTGASEGIMFRFLKTPTTLWLIHNMVQFTETA